MAGKRIYITVPKRDFDLIRFQAMTEGKCPGYWARDAVLGRLYHLLTVDRELLEHDQALARQEREELLRGR